MPFLGQRNKLFFKEVLMNPLRRFNNSWGNFFWSINEDNDTGWSQSYVFDGMTHNSCFSKDYLWKGSNFSY
jgi:hypothetical protein